MLSGVLITHAHSDHVHESMLKRLTKEQVLVFCHRNVSRVLLKQYSTMRDAKKLDLIKTFKNETFTIGSFTIQAFEVPHDSKGGCFGFTIYHHSDSGNKKITVATDMGYPQNDTLIHFLDSDVIIIESNHDQDMLTQSLRPAWLKKRIKKIGHLSNGQCTDFLEQVLSHSEKKPKAIILAHISQECNTNARAIQCVQKNAPAEQPF
jgi:phosphoribosyl 1,2-cyclic phosphodiesterase